MLYLNADFRGYFRLKLSLTSRGSPQWLILFKDLLNQNNCKEYMNIKGEEGGGEVKLGMGALFNFFVFKTATA